MCSATVSRMANCMLNELTAVPLSPFFQLTHSAGAGGECDNLLGNPKSEKEGFTLLRDNKDPLTTLESKFLKIDCLLSKSLSILVSFECQDHHKQQ